MSGYQSSAYDEIQEKKDETKDEDIKEQDQQVHQEDQHQSDHMYQGLISPSSSVLLDDSIPLQAISFLDLFKFSKFIGVGLSRFFYYFGLVFIIIITFL